MAAKTSFKPGGRGSGDEAFFVVYFIISALALYFLRIDSGGTVIPDSIIQVQKAGNWKQFGHDVPARQHYTGLGLFDQGLSFLVTCFFPGSGSLDAGYWLLQLYFLINFFAVIGIWTIEATRVKNKNAITSFTTIWALFYQTVGGAVIVPLYYIAYLWDTRAPDYFSPSSRTVRLPYAKSLLPALIVGYLIPTIGIYLPYDDNKTTKQTTQLWTAIWQLSPLYVNVILVLFSKLFPYDAETSKKTVTADIPYLRWVYLTIVAVGLITHLGTVVALMQPTTDPNYNSHHVFFQAPYEFFWAFPNEKSSFFTAMTKIFQWDFWLIFLASLIWAWQGLWDLKRTGLAQINLVKSAVVLVVAGVLVGPATVLGAVWFFREEKMAGEEGEIAEKKEQ